MFLTDVTCYSLLTQLLHWLTKKTRALTLKLNHLPEYRSIPSSSLDIDFKVPETLLYQLCVWIVEGKNNIRAAACHRSTKGFPKIQETKNKADMSHGAKSDLVYSILDNLAIQLKQTKFRPTDKFGPNRRHQISSCLGPKPNSLSSIGTDYCSAIETLVKHHAECS